jgi:MtN3 and saliva related transmembrane protein
MSIGLHHWHKRKAKKPVFAKGMHSKGMQQLLDNLIYVASVTSIAANLPQLLKIWVDHTSAGVSLFSWATFLVSSLFWVFYGYVHKSIPLIILNASVALVQLFIVIGIIIKP